MYENLSLLHEYLIHISCVREREREREKKDEERGRKAIFLSLSLVIAKLTRLYFVAF